MIAKHTNNTKETIMA